MNREAWEWVPIMQRQLQGLRANLVNDGRHPRAIAREWAKMHPGETGLVGVANTVGEQCEVHGGWSIFRALGDGQVEWIPVIEAWPDDFADPARDAVRRAAIEVIQARLMAGQEADHVPSHVVARPPWAHLCDETRIRMALGWEALLYDWNMLEWSLMHPDDEEAADQLEEEGHGEESFMGACHASGISFKFCPFCGAALPELWQLIPMEQPLNSWNN